MKNKKNLKIKSHKVEDVKFNSWVIKMRHTTYEAIVERLIAKGTPLSRQTIANMFATQQATPKTESIITKHFNEMEVEA